MTLLPDNAPEKWEYTEHAKVKHEILRKYLTGWSRITGSGYGRYGLTYVDGFAGRGQYIDSNEVITEGSPVIALENAPKWLNHTERVDLHFVEANRDNFANLTEVIRSKDTGDPRIIIYPWNKPFSEAIENLLPKVPFNNPAFFFIDPFGFGGVPFEVVKKILKRPRAEVFFTFMVRDISRMLTSDNHATSLTSLFGTTAWREIASRERDRELALRDLYIDQVRKEAQTPYVWTFRVCMDDARRTLYYLIHVANHWMGCALMKGVMYNQGGAGVPGSFAFLGPDDALAKSQLNFFNNPDDIEPLIPLLLARFRGKSPSFDDCMAETIHLPEYHPYIEKHYRAACRQLEEAGTITITRITSKKSGISDKDRINFPD